MGKSAWELIFLLIYTLKRYDSYKRNHTFSASIDKFYPSPRFNAKIRFSVKLLGKFNYNPL